MKLWMFFLGSIVLASACQKNSNQEESDSFSRNKQPFLPIKGEFSASDIHTVGVAQPINQTPRLFKDIEINGDKIDIDTAGMTVDINENGEGTLQGQSHCRELGLKTLNISTQFMPQELILATSGYARGISFLAKPSDVSKCRNQLGENFAQSVRPVLPSKNTKGEALDKFTLDGPIPMMKGPLGMSRTANGECKKLHNRKMIRILVENNEATELSAFNREPEACIGFLDKELKQLRLIVSHTPTGFTLVDFVEAEWRQ